MFGLVSLTEHEIKTEKCLDTCQYKIKFALTFSRNDQTLVEICTVALYFGSDIYQIKLGFVQVNHKSARKMSDVRLLFHTLTLVRECCIEDGCMSMVCMVVALCLVAEG